MPNTKTDPRNMPWELVPYDFRKSGAIFNWYAYSKIVVRKHGISPPEPDFESLTTEEIDALTTVLRDLAHLPPA